MNKEIWFLALLFMLLGACHNRNVNQGEKRRFSVYDLDKRLYPVLDSVITRIKHHPGYKNEYFGIRMSFIENVVDKRSEFALYPVFYSYDQDTVVAHYKGYDIFVNWGLGKPSHLQNTGKYEDIQFIIPKDRDSSLVTSPLDHNLFWIFIVWKDSSIMKYVYPELVYFE